MDDGPSASARERRVRVIGVAAVSPVLIALALAALDVRTSAREPHLPCPLYPNAVVAFAAELHEDCPLQPGDTIVAIDVDGGTEAVESMRDLSRRLVVGRPTGIVLRPAAESNDRRAVLRPVVREASTAWIHFAAVALVAALLLVFALLTAVRSGAPLAAPFASIHSALGVLLVCAVAGWTSSLTYPLAALARALLPACLIHVAFVFPRTREVTLRVPGIHRVVYGVCLGLFLLELGATYRGPASTMLLIQRIQMAGTAIAVLLLCFSSWLSMRESPSRLERGQARVFLTGVAAVLVVAWAAWLTEPPGGSLTAVTLAAALAPAPLGYAIARYHLFDFGMTLRRAVAHALYLSIWSGLFFVGIILVRDRLPVPAWLQNPIVVFAGVYGVLAPLDGVRHLLKRFIEHAFQPEAKTWARLTEGRAARIAHLRDPDEICRAAVGLAAEGLPGAGISLFVGDGHGYRLAHATGAAACEDPAVAVLARRLVADADVIDLNRLDTVATEAATVFDAGVELVSVIATGGAHYGLILACPQRRGFPHPAAPVTWLRLIGIHTAAALENARLAEQLREAEQFAIRGRMHAALAHEIGKPLGALERLAQKLATDPSAAGSVHERASSIARISGQLRDIVRGVLRPAGSAGQLEVAQLIERACLEIACIHGPDAVLVRPLPPLPALDRGAEGAVRALTNLIDNAIRANAPGEPVEVRALVHDGTVEIEVADRGSGLAPGELERVFDAFVSLRPGGHGLGLTISRQIVEGLGGSIVLESSLGQGTLARLRLPAARDG